MNSVKCDIILLLSIIQKLNFCGFVSEVILPTSVKNYMSVRVKEGGLNVLLILEEGNGRFLDGNRYPVYVRHCLCLIMSLFPMTL